MTTLKKISAIACLFIVTFLICRTTSAQETKTFVAYSMKVAQARVEDAMRKGEDFRKKQPDLYYLGGITKPWAVVLDTETNDWILVGERDPKSSILTLDDWVVALRARFIYPDKDPGVTIDPRRCEACVKSGKKEGCSHSTKQDVRFFGGIEDTHFGQICYEADWLMKKIGLSLEKLPINNLKSYFDLSTEQARNSGASSTKVSSRFWFYPIINQVNVIGDVALLENFKMGVFTEVLYAEVGGKPVADIDKFEHYPSEGFSRSFSENYDAAAQAREVLETLRGLTRLAALAKGLTQADGKPKVDFYMSGYPIGKSKTLLEVEVLKNESREGGFCVVGGVQLMALAMRLKGGDASALKELVLKGRKVAGPNPLTWGFEIQMQGGKLAGVVIPEGSVDYDQIVPLFQQAFFLGEKKRYDDAITLYGKIIELKPDWDWPYNNRGNAYKRKGEYDRAISDFNEALEINPRLAEAYYNRGLAYNEKGEYDRAISDFNIALEINPRLAEAYNDRGLAYKGKGEYDRAISDYNEALEINPRYAEAYNNRGLTYAKGKGSYDRAILDYDKALEINPRLAEAYVNRGAAYHDKGSYDRAILDYDKALEISPRLAEAYNDRGLAYKRKGSYDRAISDYNEALEINPRYAEAYNNRGSAYNYKGSYDRAIGDYNKALEINPRYADAYVNRGIVYHYKGEYDRAISDFNKALEINPRYAGAYNNRGLTYAEGKGSYDRAILDYDKALEINPEFAGAYYNRGNAYNDKGEHDRAISDFNIALELNPRYATAYNNRAVAYYFKKMYDKAWDDVYKAQRLDYQVPPGFLKALREDSGRDK